jgi:hypothetical protein
MQLMAPMFDQDVTRLCRPDGKHNAERAGYRRGSEDGPVTVGPSPKFNGNRHNLPHL